MSDPPPVMVPSPRPSDFGARSAAAILSYIFLFLFLLAGFGVFVLVGISLTNSKDGKMDPVLVGVLASYLTAVVAGPSAVASFWLANSMQANRAAARPAGSPG